MQTKYTSLPFLKITRLIYECVLGATEDNYRSGWLTECKIKVLYFMMVWMRVLVNVECAWVTRQGRTLAVQVLMSKLTRVPTAPTRAVTTLSWSLHMHKAHCTVHEVTAACSLLPKALLSHSVSTRHARLHAAWCRLTSTRVSVQRGCSQYSYQPVPASGCCSCCFSSSWLVLSTSLEGALSSWICSGLVSSGVFTSAAWSFSSVVPLTWTLSIFIGTEICFQVSGVDCYARGREMCCWHIHLIFGKKYSVTPVNSWVVYIMARMWPWLTFKRVNHVLVNRILILGITTRFSEKKLSCLTLIISRQCVIKMLNVYGI